MGKKLKCTQCNDIIESKYRHDYVNCKCGKIFVDGGNDYLRCGGEELDYILFDFNGEWLNYQDVKKFESIKQKEQQEMILIENGKKRIKQAKNEILDILKKYDCKLQVRNLQTLGLVTEDYVVNQIIQETIEL